MRIARADADDVDALCDGRCLRSFFLGIALCCSARYGILRQYDHRVPSASGDIGACQIIDEVKLGALGHDVGFLGDNIEHGPDVNAEVLFVSPDFLSIIGSPRPHIGGDINTAGETSDAYVGLTWGVSLIQNLLRPGDYIFANGSLGGAYQDGFIDNAPIGRKRLGSPVLFRESAELGYQITPMVSVSAILDHISNANLAQLNAGITSAGGRVGFKF